MKTQNSVKFRLLKNEDIKKFNNFIKNQLSGAHIFSYSTKLFDWQHKWTENYHCMAAFKDTDLIGIQGIIPQCQFDVNLPRNQIFLALWIVDESKEIGVGIRLYEYILKEYKPEFIGSTGLNDKMIPFHKWKGFTVGKLNHHVILSPYINDFKGAIVPHNFKKNIRINKNTVGSKFSFKIINEKSLIRFDTTELYANQTPLKSDDYLVERYINHPVYSYILCALLENNKIVSICVIRPIAINNSTVLRLVDYIGKNLYLPIAGNFRYHYEGRICMNLH